MGSYGDTFEVFTWKHLSEEQWKGMDFYVLEYVHYKNETITKVELTMWLTKKSYWIQSSVLRLLSPGRLQSICRDL